ncbi:unnamed protein product, partial [Ceratitis capitata]
MPPLVDVMRCTFAIDVEFICTCDKGCIAIDQQCKRPTDRPNRPPVGAYLRHISKICCIPAGATTWILGIFTLIH